MDTPHTAPPEAPLDTGSDLPGEGHWADKDGVRLSLWRKRAPQITAGTILFVHGSSMSARPTFDLDVPGHPDSSAMNWFARRGFDAWCVDMEGYGASDKHRDINCDISNGADDLAAASAHIQNLTGCGPLLVYGISSGALRAGLFGERHPERVARLALDALVWTGAGSPTLEQRRKKLPEFLARNRRPIDRAFIHSVFDRDHPDTAARAVIDAFAEAVLTYDDSMPTGTYVDMCSKLPVLDPERLTVPTLIMRGEHDGIASLEDLLAYFSKIACPDKAFAIMPGISHASFQQKNYALVYHILHSFFTQPAPAYRG